MASEQQEEMCVSKREGRFPFFLETMSQQSIFCPRHPPPSFDSPSPIQINPMKLVRKSIVCNQKYSHGASRVLQVVFPSYPHSPYNSAAPPMVHHMHSYKFNNIPGTIKRTYKHFPRQVGSERKETTWRKCNAQAPRSVSISSFCSPKNAKHFLHKASLKIPVLGRNKFDRLYISTDILLKMEKKKRVVSDLGKTVSFHPQKESSWTYLKVDFWKGTWGPSNISSTGSPWDCVHKASSIPSPSFHHGEIRALHVSLLLSLDR